MKSITSSNPPDNIFAEPKWKSTLSFIQKLIHTLKDFQVTKIDEKACSLQHSLMINNKGFNSFEIPDFGQFFIDLYEQTISFYNATHEQLFKTSFVNSTLSEIFKSLKDFFSSRNQIFDYPTENIDNEKIAESSQALPIYFSLVWSVFTSLARLKAILPLNPATPIAYWTHHFDMGFLYFHTGKSNSEQDPHINIGFSPIGEESDKDNYPYYYIYCWNGSDYVKDFSLPEGLSWRNHFCKLPISQELSDSQETEKLLGKTINLFLKQIS